jgi:hypothetical protein
MITVQIQLSYSQSPKWRLSSTLGEAVKVWGGGRGVRGGVLVGTPLPAQAMRVPVVLVYTAANLILVINPVSLSFPFTFLCIAATGQ